MNFALMIYLIDRLDSVVYGPLTFLSYIGSVMLLFLWAIYQVFGGKPAAIEYARKRDYGKRTEPEEAFTDFFYNLPKKAIMWCCMPLVVLSLLVPDKDTMYTMLAAYGVQEVAESENVQKFAGKSLDVLEKAMDEYLAEKN